jgi:hypothetical protein
MVWNWLIRLYFLLGSQRRYNVTCPLRIQVHMLHSIMRFLSKCVSFTYSGGDNNAIGIENVPSWSKYGAGAGDIVLNAKDACPHGRIEKDTYRKEKVAYANGRGLKMCYAAP